MNMIRMCLDIFQSGRNDGIMNPVTASEVVAGAEMLSWAARIER
jgi:hypothetical protein